MALSRTWYTHANVTLDDTTTSFRVMQSLAFAIKAFLKGEKTGTNGTNGAPPIGSRWTHVASSDGVTTSTVTDLWGSTFDATKLVRAAAGVAHSWIVLRSPTTLTSLGVPFYLLLSLGSPDNTRMMIVGAKTAFAGGTNIADPTSANSWTYSGGPVIQDVTAAATHRANYVTDANGNFFITFARAGTGAFHTIMGYMGFVNTNPTNNDLFPVCTIYDSRVGSRGSCDGAGALCNQTGANTVEGIHMRSPDGTVVSTTNEGNGIMSPLNLSFFTRITINQGSSLHDAISCNIHFYSSTGTVGAVRGHIPDWFLANNAKPVGNCEPTVGFTEHVLVGNIYVPNDGVVPLI